MAKRLKALAESAGDDSQLASTVRRSAHQIWLAGLGAFMKAQEEGAKVFEALVKEGKTLEGKTRKIAEAKMSAVASRWGKTANEATGKATATWDKLEQVFEGRVARALKRLGVPTNRDVQALAKQVEELSASVRKLSRRKPRGAADKPPAPRTPNS